MPCTWGILAAATRPRACYTAASTAEEYTFIEWVLSISEILPFVFWAGEILPVKRMFSMAGKLYEDAKKRQDHETLEAALFAAANTE